MSTSDSATLPLVGAGTSTCKAEADDDIFWSVTTIIDVLDKPALIPWAVGVTAERAVDKLDVVRARLANEGRDSAVDYMKGLRWQNEGRVSDSALGTIAHALFNDYALTGARPTITRELHPDNAKDGTLLHEDDVRSLAGMLNQFDAFLQQFRPSYEATEVVVYSPTYRYAGQCDGFGSISGVPLIFDYKTSRRSWDYQNRERTPYPEIGLQLAAYRYATHAAIWRARRYETTKSRRYYLLNETEKAAAVPLPVVDGGVGVYVTPERFGVYPVRCGPREHEAFLFCLEVARWSFNEAKHVVGNAMIPPLPPAALVDDDPFAGLPKE